MSLKNAFRQSQNKSFMIFKQLHGRRNLSKHKETITQSLKVYKILVHKARWNSSFHWLDHLVIQLKKITNKPYIFVTSSKSNRRSLYNDKNLWNITESFQTSKYEVYEYSIRPWCYYKSILCDLEWEWSLEKYHHSFTLVISMHL